MMEKGFRIWDFFRKLLSGHFFSVRFVSVRSRARFWRLVVAVLVAGEQRKDEGK